MNSRTLSAVAAGVVLSVVLAGCGGTENPQSAGDSPSSGPTPSSMPTADQNVGATCAGVSVAMTSLSAAEQLIHIGDLSAEDREPVTRVVSASLFALASQPGIGLKTQLDVLIAAETPGGPPLVGTSFDADNADFQSALGELRDSCDANGTPLILWSAIEGG
jgi:hypothetical protein